MHEWALAESVVKYLNNVVGGGRLKSVKIGLGELQSIDEEVFKFALIELMRIEGYEPSKVSLEFIKKSAKLKCRKCGYSWKLSDVGLSDEEREAIHFVPEVIHAYVACPKCSSRDFEVVEGRGVEVVEVIVE